MATNLIVQFQPNGDSVLYPDAVMPIATGGVNPTSNTMPTSTSQFGGTSTGGWFGWFSAAAGKGYLYWKPVGNGVHRVWTMDSVAAAQAAIVVINTELLDVTTGGTGYILINSAGALVNNGS